MRTQMGKWNFNSSDSDQEWIERAKSRFLTDGIEWPNVFSSGGLSVVCCGIEPTQGRVSEKLPDGSVVFWDGRLDNGPDLFRELGGMLDSKSSDSEIATAAFDRWHTDAFCKMLGDWSLVAWNPNDQSLILAKDPIGTRPLFYQLTSSGLRWSSALEWLVEDGDSPLKMNLEYLAGWLSFFPAAGLTPYEPIQSVPPSSFVRLTAGKKTVEKYWDFVPGEQIRYRSEGEYDESFRSLLAQAVRRRLRAKGPILAELSGGMDSSSIVCMADVLASRRGLGVPQPDTVSYYDNSEPNWNELPYLRKVEEKRGRGGFHIALDAAQELDAFIGMEDFAATPAECARHSLRNRGIKELVAAKGYVAILSGIGGDEFTGGVPTGQPELADLLAEGRLFSFSRRLLAWAISQRRPWAHLLFDTAGSFLPRLWTKADDARRPAGWLLQKFVSRHRHALYGYRRHIQILGARPSFQENLSALDVVRRQLACSHTSSRLPFDKRYPYLDRDLLEFLFAVPRQQLIQPGRRRALMRRALVGIVPDEILTRKRKAYVVRAPRVAIAARWEAVAELAKSMVAESLGIVSSKLFQQALEDVRTGNEVAVQAVIRTLVLEKWLRTLVKYDVLSDPISPTNELAAAGRSPLPQPERAPSFS
jgi:asparagine synthase (glutamine-hydrolysing)